MPGYDTPDWQKKFRNILADIRQGKCVLLIGPEMVRIGNRTLREALREQLNENNMGDIAHYYDRDGLFLFRDKVAKEDVQREVVLFYEKHHTESDVQETLFKQLAQIKFPLVLSINPDNFLSDVAYKYGLKHRFAYFQHSGEAVQGVEEPTTETPLYYNLAGSLERDNSLVLDYDDLFEMLTSLLGTPRLPDKLAVALQNTKHFLFLGFDFDKWYTQLLLKLLSGEKAIRKFVVDYTEKNDNTTTFLVKQFGIEFIEEEQAFFEELYRRCGEEGLLRELTEQQTPDRVRVTRWVSNNNLPKAFETLVEIGRHGSLSTLERDTLQLQARFLDLRDRESRKLIDSRDYLVEYNRIVDSLLELTREYLHTP